MQLDVFLSLVSDKKEVLHSFMKWHQKLIFNLQIDPAFLGSFRDVKLILKQAKYGKIPKVQTSE